MIRMPICLTYQFIIQYNINYWWFKKLWELILINNVHSSLWKYLMSFFQAAHEHCLVII